MKIIGHRGAKGLAPENTIASFMKALEHSVDEIECDVRITKDGIVAVIHDPRLTDAAGNRLQISQHTFAELKAHKADLPTLEEAVLAINKKVPLQIEVKPNEPIQPVVACLRQLLDNGWRSQDFVLSSKSFALLQDLHRALPDIQKVVIERWSGVRATYHARKLGTPRLSMNQLWLWRGFIGPMSKRGYQLSAYPLNNPKRAQVWKKYGLYGAVTDFPDRFEK